MARWTTARSSSASSAAAARVPPRRRPLSVRPPGGDRAAPVRADGRAVPDDVLRHVPPPRRRDRRGSRPQAASSAGPGGRETTPSSRRASRARRASSAASAASSPAARPAGRRRVARARGSAALAARRQPQVPARARRLRARAAGLRAGRADPRRGGTALAAAVLHGGSTLIAVAAVELARHEWADGHRPLEGARGEPRATRLLEQVDALTDELRRRVGGRRSRSPSSPPRTRRGGVGARDDRGARARAGLAARPGTRRLAAAFTPTSAARATTRRDRAGPRAGCASLLRRRAGRSRPSCARRLGEAAPRQPEPGGTQTLVRTLTPHR